MSTFGAATFEEILAENGTARSFASSVTGRRLTMMGGQRTIFQRNSAAVHLQEVDALCSYAELVALRGKIGSSAMLTLRDTAGVALLLGVDSARVYDSTCYTARMRFRYGGSLTVPGVGGYGFEWSANWGNE